MRSARADIGGTTVALCWPLSWVVWRCVNLPGDAKPWQDSCGAGRSAVGLVGLGSGEMSSDPQEPPSHSKPEEDGETLAQRMVSLSDEMWKLFWAAVEQVGLEQASRLWTATLDEHTRKRGRPARSVLSSWDALLLEVYDRMVTDPNPATLTRHLGMSFYESSKGRYQSPEAVERRLRRRLAERKAGNLVREAREGYGVPRYRVRPPSRGQ